MNQEVIAYRKHMNLKLAAAELGVAWQSLYVRLKQLGEPVTGDKMRYGSDRDKLAAMAEAKFLQLVPFAIDQNKMSWQSNAALRGAEGVPLESTVRGENPGKDEQ